MIQRYDPEVIRQAGDYWSTMAESEDGDYVTHADHRAAVRELIEALHHISLASQNSMSSKEECGRIARAAIAKATEGEG